MDGYAMLREIADLGFESDFYERKRYELTVKIDRSQLGEASKAFGKLTVLGKNIDNAEKRTITVRLKGDKYDKLYIEYTRPLPPHAKCQIVTLRREAYEYQTLVCSY